MDVQSAKRKKSASPNEDMDTDTTASNNNSHTKQSNKDKEGLILAFGDLPFCENGHGSGIIKSNENEHLAQLEDLRAVAAGSKHTIYLLNNGEVIAVGSNESGQLGIKPDAENKQPVSKIPRVIPYLQSLKITQVMCGDVHSAALTNTGHLYTWGSNSYGQLGLAPLMKLGDTASFPCEVNLTEVVQAACGANHTIALTAEGALYSWGFNQHGQLGLGHNYTMEKPTSIESLKGVPIGHLVCGADFTVLVTVSGAVFAFGGNAYGQLGCGDTQDKLHPTQVRPLRQQKIVSMSCGAHHCAALTADGRVFSYGSDFYGQLGHGRKEEEHIPRQIVELMGTQVARVDCGRSHTCVSLSDGRLFGFGCNYRGQTGRDNSQQTVATPSTVAKVRNVHSLLCAGDQTYVKTTSKQGVFPVKPGPSTSYGEVKHLTLESVEHGLKVAFSQLIQNLEAVFCSLASVNCSFLKSNLDHLGASRMNSGVDCDAAMEVRRALNESSHKEQILRVIQKSLEWSLLSSLVPSPPDVEALRVYLTLPWCPVFDNPAHFRTIHLPFATALTSLSANPSKVIMHWWELFEIRHFSRILRVFKGVVSHVLSLNDLHEQMPFKQQEITHRKCAIKVCLDLLSKLNEVNLSQKKIPFDMFYINELSDKLDIRQEYVRFSLEKDNKKFSFCHYPFIFNAQVKTALLQTDAAVQMQWLVEQTTMRNFESMFFQNLPQASPYLILQVNRERIVEDTISQLLSTSLTDLHKPLKVVFHKEEGDDAGGVKKEFFMLLFQELLHPKYGMFVENEESRMLWFSTTPFENGAMYELVGLLFGLAIYNSVLVYSSFPLALYKKLLGQSPNAEDLCQLSPTEGRSLIELLDYEEDDFDEVFDLTFEIQTQVFGTIHTEELKPGGSNIIVTKASREEYVNLYVNYKLNKSIKTQFEKFAEGFHRVVRSRILVFFQPQELMEMVVGNQHYDWDQFEKNTAYQGEYWRYHPTIKIFWEVFHELTGDEKQKFLLFLTGSDRIPLLGMKSLKMTIQPVSGDTRLPVAHTCFNLLDLPKIDSKQVMSAKLRLAIQHHTGFTLV